MEYIFFKQLAGLLVPLFAISLPVLILIVVLAGRRAEQRQRHETITKFLDKGQPVPEQLLQYQAVRSPLRSSPLRLALGLIGLGLGLATFLGMVGDPGWWALGAVPLAVGLAQALAWHLEKPPVQASVERPESSATAG